MGTDSVKKIAGPRVMHGIRLFQGAKVRLSSSGRSAIEVESLPACPETPLLRLYLCSSSCLTRPTLSNPLRTPAAWIKRTAAVGGQLISAALVSAATIWRTAVSGAKSRLKSTRHRLGISASASRPSSIATASSSSVAALPPSLT